METDYCFDDKFNTEFKPLDHIGCGRFGNVLKAKNLADNKLYAFEKIYCTEYSVQQIETIIKELEELTKLQNDYIVNHISFWTENNVIIFIQKEFLSFSLKNVIEYKRKYFDRSSEQMMTSLEFIISTELLKGLLNSLQYLHGLDPPIVHKYLTINNIFIVDNNSNEVMIKIGDICSTKLDNIFEEQLKHSKSYTYIAPEVINGKKYDTKADVYSLGIIAEQLFDIEYDNYEVLICNSKLADKYESVWKTICNMRTAPDWKSRPTCADLLKSVTDEFDLTIDELMIDANKIECLKKLSENNLINLFNNIIDRNIKTKRMASEQIAQRLVNSVNNPINSNKIMISYVHTEASTHARLLKQELINLGYPVFLDLDEIQAGHDWANCLNNAVLNCTLFVALITPNYGMTRWTDREIKLADKKAKQIIPISFLDDWPPDSLAILLATIQYIPWKTSETDEKEMDINLWHRSDVQMTAQLIHKYYQSRDRTRQDMPLSQRRAPEAHLSFQKTVKRQLIVISAHPKQHRFVQSIRDSLSKSSFEIWSSTDMTVEKMFENKLNINKEKSNGLSAEQVVKLRTFKEQVDSATLVVMVLSDDYNKSQTSKRQAFYCTYSKRHIAIKCEDIRIPFWLSKLLDRENVMDNTDSRTFAAKVSDLAASGQYQSRSKRATTDAKIQSLADYVCKQLPNNKLFVYVVGSTHFNMNSTKPICTAIGRTLARIPDLVLVTDGCYGVAESIAAGFDSERRKLSKSSPVDLYHILPRSDNSDMSMKARQNSDGSFQSLPSGQTVFIGDSFNERNSMLGRTFKYSIVVEGGPRTANIADDFLWNDNIVIPIACTGGAAADQYNWPINLHKMPLGVNKEDWDKLFKQKIPAKDIAESVKNIICSLAQFN